MMFLITLSNLTNAIKTARKKRARVRRVDVETFEVRCQQGHKHIVRFETNEDRVFVCCDCPSRVMCYHCVHANDLRQALIEAAKPAHVATSEDMDKSLLVIGPRRTGEKSRGISI